MSSETTLAKSRGGTAQDNSSLTFPASGTIPTLAGTETFSNKTFSDAVTLAEVATPATPSSGFGKVYFKSDGFLYQLNDDGSESKVGAGTGGVNYITNPDAESNTTGWAAYADAAGTSPVDGTGGAPTTTITRVTSSPLRGTGMFRITKDAANRQGEGVSYDFTIAAADKAKPITVSFEYNPSANFAAGDSSDIRVWLYDVTNSTLIQPAPYTIQGGSGSNHKFSATFQTASNSTSYRLIFHIATTNASAWTFDFDNVVVGPQVQLYGAAVSDWTDYTPTGAWTTNTIYSAKWRRVGDSMEIEGRVVLAGAPTSATFTFSLPSGYTVDTAKVSRSDNGLDSTTFGHAKAADVGTGVHLGAVYYNNTTTVGVMGDDGSSVWSETVPLTFGNTDAINIKFTVPILGWSSNVLMSNDADTRVVSARASTTAGQSIASGGTPIIVFGTETFDTHGAFNAATGVFTAPVSGKYRVSGFIRYANASFTATNSVSLQLFKNGSLYSFLGVNNIEVTATNLHGVGGSDEISLVAGDTIDLRTSHGEGTARLLDTTGEQNWIAIDRISGPSTIAASETVAGRFSTAAGQSIPNSTDTVVDFGTTTFDTHGAKTGTGASWKYTAPVNGKYRVSATLTASATSGWEAGEQFLVQLFKNGSVYSYLSSSIQVASHSQGIVVSGSDVVPLNAGDYITIVISQSNDGTVTLEADAKINWVSIEKIGGTP